MFVDSLRDLGTLGGADENLLNGSGDNGITTECTSDGGATGSGLESFGASSLTSDFWTSFSDRPLSVDAEFVAKFGVVITSLTAS